MKIIYLAYANSEEHPLKSLKNENSRINEILVDRKRAGHFLLETDSYATIGSIAGYLNKYREELEFFGFSGHAGRDALIAEDAPAHAGGIAHLLGLCPNLKVVLLNGCSTVGQVNTLLEKRIPVIIATDSPVNDSLAKDFAVALFGALCEDRSLSDSFEHAKGVIITKSKTIRFDANRALVLRSESDGLWGLFGDEEAARRWRLPAEEAKAKGAPFSLSELERLEREGLGRQAELLLKKLGRIREALAVATDPSTQFKYEVDIENIEKELAQLRNRIS
jgi:hypothetical protein